MLSLHFKNRCVRQVYSNRLLWTVEETVKRERRRTNHPGLLSKLRLAYRDIFTEIGEGILAHHRLHLRQQYIMSPTENAANDYQFGIINIDDICQCYTE